MAPAVAHRRRQRLWRSKSGSPGRSFGKNKYLYNGKELNADYEINLYEYGARWYGPAVGRFTGVDPIVEEFPHLSVYDYASNEPVNNIDLHGLQAGGNMYQQMEKTERIAKDALTIAGGALLIVGTGGSASPLVVAGGTIGGTYGMASGTAQLITDATGDFAKSDAVPETAAGFLAQPIDQALGGENRLAEKSADFAQNLFVAIYPKSVSEGVLIHPSVIRGEILAILFLWPARRKAQA